MKTDNYAEYLNILSAQDGSSKLLLHVCCAPCMSAGICELAEKFKVTVYFYNPNIRPRAEYEKRLKNVCKLIDGLGLDIDVIAEEYIPDEYESAVGEYFGGAEHGEKCRRCTALRIDRTARKCAELGYDYFTTTLTASPLKNADELNGFMRDAAAKYAVKYLPSDFKKNNGNLKIKKICDACDIYRQRYCGCTPASKLIVAVTGGIASGKSVLTGMLGKLGAYTIDADKITRELQREGEPVCEEIKRTFPDCVSGGKLDRNALKKAVFSDERKLSLLESIVHPAVKAEMKRRALASDSPITVIEVPLLFESGCSSIADVIVNVRASEDIRRTRAFMRDGMDGDMFDRVRRAQLSDEERTRLSDVTVVNDGTAESLGLAAKELYDGWLDRLKQA